MKNAFDYARNASFILVFGYGFTAIASQAVRNCLPMLPW